MDRLNFNHLFYFYVVAKEGSIKDAAEKIYISQPTISDQIKLLEEYLQCKLFERKHRALFLTREGKQALKYAETIFDLSNELTSKLRNKSELPKKTLDIGITHSMSHYFIYKNLQPLFEQTEIKVNIKEDNRRYLLADLEEQRIDIVFTDSKENLHSTLNPYRLGHNRIFVVAHKKYHKYRKDFPNCLNKIPFFNYTNESSTKYEIEIFFSKNSVSPKIIGEADDIDLFQFVTQEGHAFTIVPEVAKNRFCLDKNIIVLGELKELQTSVWGIIKNSYRGLGYKFLTGKM